MKKIILGVLILIMAIGLTGCGGDDEFGARIVVVNLSSVTVDVDMDGVYYLTIAPGASGTITNVPEGTRGLIAYVSGTDIVVNTTSIVVALQTDYLWEVLELI